MKTKVICTQISLPIPKLISNQDSNIKLKYIVNKYINTLIFNVVFFFLIIKFYFITITLMYIK